MTGTSMIDKTKDYKGSEVIVGSKVRVLSIDSGLLSSLPADEKFEVESMVGDTLSVYEIDDSGFAMVEKGWELGTDQYMSHSIALASEEMKLIE